MVWYGFKKIVYSVSRPWCGGAIHFFGACMCQCDGVSVAENGGMKFRQVEAFRCVMATGSISAAALRMSVTQPAISRLITDLELDLGFTLFHRVRGRLQASTEGVRFHQAVEENFLGLERLSVVAQRIRQEEPRGLTIACLPVLSTSLLPPAIALFRAQAPEVPLRIDTAAATQIVERLQDLKADLALTLSFPPLAGIEIEPLFEAGVLCAMPAGHRLAAKPVLELKDLHGEDCIGWMPSGPLTPVEEEQMLEKAGVQPRYVLRTHTSHTRYALVAQGLGLSLVEPFGASLWQAHGVVTRPIADASSRYSYVLAYPSTGLRNPALLGLRAALQTALKAWQPQAPVWSSARDGAHGTDGSSAGLGRIARP